MSRVPTPGGDIGTWGDILNDFLAVEHFADGSQKPLAQSKVINLVSDLSAKAPINNPTFTGTVTLPGDPTVNFHAATKQYVDNMTLASAPDATTTTKGIVQLAGDLSGTAASPQIAAGVIVNTDINSAAAIDKTKLAALNIVDGDVAAGAAIAQSKVANLVSDLASKVPSSLVDAKGDLIVATAADTLTRLPVGANGLVLMADSAEAAGVRWATGSTPSLTGLRGAAATTDMLSTGVIGDTFDRFVLDADGTMWTGSGAAAPNRSLWTTSGATAVGQEAGRDNTVTTFTGLGRSAGRANTTGNQTTAVGWNVLSANTTGSNNTALGSSALQSNISGNNSTAIGSLTLVANTASDNTAVGTIALTANTTGIANVAIGSTSLSANTTGSGNIALGLNSMRFTTIGGGNLAIGTEALYSNTSGNASIAIGDGALRSVTVGGNLAVGISALYGPGGVLTNATTTGLRQTAVGYQTGQNSSTQRNDIVAIGYQALVGGNNAIAIGSGVLAGAAGTVAIGKDSAGTSASTTTANEIKLGTALHTLNIIGNASIGGSSNNLGFYAATPAAKQAVTGSRGGNAALASLLTALATIGLITDSSTA